MVVVETEEMFKARKEAEANHKALRPPLVVSHSIPATGSSNMSWLFQRMVITNVGINGFGASYIFVYAGYLCMLCSHFVISNPSVWLLFVCFNVWNEIIVNMISILTCVCFSHCVSDWLVRMLIMLTKQEDSNMTKTIKSLLCNTKTIKPKMRESFRLWRTSSGTKSWPVKLLGLLSLPFRNAQILVIQRLASIQPTTPRCLLLSDYCKIFLAIVVPKRINSV